MYAYINGILKQRDRSKVIVENSGLGYELNITTTTYNNLPEPPEKVMLYTYHYIREDREELYGFATKGEKELFEILINLSNIGPSKTINILSQIEPEHFVRAIKKEDISYLSSIKGIGRKTAQRLIVDLKDRIPAVPVTDKRLDMESSKVEDAFNGLRSLGFKENVARNLINSIINEIQKEDKAEEIIKKALKRKSVEENV
ncbi:MAG: Holliday junction branch migration protein RuvA [Elusimicrobiota bacterium]